MADTSQYLHDNKETPRVQGHPLILMSGCGKLVNKCSEHTKVKVSVKGKVTGYVFFSESSRVGG
jgi:hypothetical protein